MEAWLEKQFMKDTYTPSSFRIWFGLFVVRLGMRIIPKTVSVSEYRFKE